MTKVVLNGVEFDLKYTFGSDMKFLLFIYGINAAHSDKSCIYCKKDKKDFGFVI